MKPYLNSSQFYPTARNFQFQVGLRAAGPAKTSEHSEQSSILSGGYKTFADMRNFATIAQVSQPPRQTSTNFYRESSGAADSIFCSLESYSSSF